ncbi:3-oxoacyl-ACP synthase [Hyunsoonleella flava]|uniref:3-oxoacyl-ACP synthase n=1 Tax=Hyunsoonleella flava TaxID=2527939 RepID=A0A4Q9FE82_9FLAO|nr:3-oxoacyl-ACP synthase [Hyunsoonleella flava]TBN03955.1 3-oxoacyl-ACP synthase [Hyunsoonleella flava]
MKVKQDLYNQCFEFIENRLQTIQTTIQDIQKSLLSETKSSAGDKHETGRAMLQLEREKAGKQLSEIQKVKASLSKINIEKTSNTVGLGSIVYTSKLNYFIAISAGEIELGNVKFYAISPSTPIAKLLLSKKVGDQITFRSLTFAVLKIE